MQLNVMQKQQHFYLVALDIR